ncbi:MAG TPA: hypothetical protein VN634_10445 [Candidatus Limnocylindrales bacterium]|nr:hypothetical protein [Candidatus Limnocylindrales bacterium]
MTSIDTLAAAFIDLTLPKKEWTHLAHLRVGLWHLLHHSPEEALSLLRVRIRTLNESHGVENSETGGYHESITRFYVWQIGEFLEAAGRERPIDELAAELIAEHGDKNLPLRYWSKDRLMSRDARVGWVEPDLEPLRAPALK